jgi:hypothetical protein
MTAKLAHQVIVCLNVLAAREGMALAEKAGIDLTMVQEVVRAGGAQSRLADSCIENKPTPNATGYGTRISCWRSSSRANSDSRYRRRRWRIDRRPAC